MEAGAPRRQVGPSPGGTPQCSVRSRVSVCCFRRDFGNHVKLTIIRRLTETECVLVQSTEGRSVVPAWETQTLMQIFDR